VWDEVCSTLAISESAGPIANAMRFLRRRHPEMSDDELDAATLNTFGRKRRSKLFAAHLAKARAHLATT